MKLLVMILAVATFSAPTLFASASISMDSEMVKVPSATFKMGCNPNKDEICSYAKDEKLHEVTIAAFQIDKYEVSIRRYQKCIDAGKCTVPAIGGAMNYGWKGAEKFPLNGVTWHQAKAFCKWEGKRLPSEAEWELAARGTDGRIYPWGNEKPDCERVVMDREQAGFMGCGTGNAMNIGSKPKGASPYGVMDMAGNLWEWTADWYDKDYYTKSPKDNPKGPASGYYKTTRGGDFFSRTKYEVRSSSRFPYDPANYSPAIGFRCAK